MPLIRKTLDYSERYEWLQSHGFKRITGEACGIGMRARYDMSPEALSLLGEMMGGATFTTGCWNPHEDGWRAVMLPDAWLRDIIIYGLLKEHARVYDMCFNTPGYRVDVTIALNGTESELDAEKERILQIYEGHARCYVKSGTANGGTMNVHEFTGRIL